MTALVVVSALLFTPSFAALRSKSLRTHVDPDGEGRAEKLAEGFFGQRRLPEGPKYDQRGWPSFERRMHALTIDPPPEIEFKQVQMCIETHTGDPLAAEDSPLVDKIDEFIQTNDFISFDEYIELSDGSYLAAMYDCCVTNSAQPARCTQNIFKTMLKTRLESLVEEIAVIMQRGYGNPADMVPEIDKYLGMNPLISFGTALQRHEATASFNGHLLFMLKQSCDSTVVVNVTLPGCNEETQTPNACVQTLQQCLLEGVEMWLEGRRREFVDGVLKTIKRFRIVERAAQIMGAGAFDVD